MDYPFLWVCRATLRGCGPGCEQLHRELGNRSEAQREAKKQRLILGLVSLKIPCCSQDRCPCLRLPCGGCRYIVTHQRPRPQHSGQCAICCPQTDHRAWGGPRPLTAYRSCLVLVPATLHPSLICVPRPSFDCHGGRVNPRDVWNLRAQFPYLRQKTGSELFCPRGTERDLQGVSLWKITFLCVEGTLER